MGLRRNTSDEASREYWRYIDAAAETVRSWPRWKTENLRAYPADRTSSDNRQDQQQSG